MAGLTERGRHATNDTVDVVGRRLISGLTELGLEYLVPATGGNSASLSIGIATARGTTLTVDAVSAAQANLALGKTIALGTSLGVSGGISDSATLSPGRCIAQGTSLGISTGTGAQANLSIGIAMARGTSLGISGGISDSVTLAIGVSVARGTELQIAGVWNAACNLSPGKAEARGTTVSVSTGTSAEVTLSPGQCIARGTEITGHGIRAPTAELSPGRCIAQGTDVGGSVSTGVVFSAPGAFTRSGAGLLVRDDFSQDTVADYDTNIGTLNVTNGLLGTDTSITKFVHEGSYGAYCVTGKLSVGTTNGPMMALWANCPLDANEDVDGYTVRIAEGSYTNTSVGKYENNGYLAFTTVGNSTTDGLARVYYDGTTLYGRTGSSSAFANVATKDTTLYAGPFYGGGMLRYAGETCDWIDIRTSHELTCTGLPSGYYLRAYDGNIYRKAQESSGTATLDAGELLFPLTTVAVYNGDPDGGGSLVVELDTGDYPNMGGGDSFSWGVGAPIARGTVLNASTGTANSASLAIGIATGLGTVLNADANRAPSAPVLTYPEEA